MSRDTRVPAPAPAPAPSPSPAGAPRVPAPAPAPAPAPSPPGAPRVPAPAPWRRRRGRDKGPAASVGPGPGAVEAALGAAAALFPRRLFGDSLPPLVLRHQLYSLTGHRTAVDRHLERLRAEGRVRLLHLGLGGDALGVVAAEAYREKVLLSVAGTPRAGLVQRFLEAAAGPELSWDRARVLGMGFRDSDITQLVAAGVLTVRDAGSWWVALPGAGRFLRALGRGRRALLGRVRRSRHREVGLEELRQRPAPPGAHLGVSYILHDLLGAQLLRSVPTPSGPMLRLAEP